MLKRKSLIVYFRNPKVLKQVEKFGEIMYFTKKKKYAVIYVNEEELQEKKKELQGLKLVRKVEESLSDTTEYQINF
jgi:uncharacterized protein YlbG (UPF0298 family)